MNSEVYVYCQSCPSELEYKEFKNLFTKVLAQLEEEDDLKAKRIFVYADNPDVDMSYIQMYVDETKSMCLVFDVDYEKYGASALEVCNDTIEAFLDEKDVVYIIGETAIEPIADDEEGVTKDSAVRFKVEEVFELAGEPEEVPDEQQEDIYMPRFLD